MLLLKYHLEHLVLRQEIAVPLNHEHRTRSACRSQAQDWLEVSDARVPTQSPRSKARPPKAITRVVHWLRTGNKEVERAGFHLLNRRVDNEAQVRQEAHSHAGHYPAGWDICRQLRRS